MATGGKPPSGKGQKPFLGEDDLASELDAWDATFDALHGGPERSGEMAQQPATDWPAPGGKNAPVELSPAPLPEQTLHDFDPGDQAAIDAQMTLDGAVEADEAFDRGFGRQPTYTAPSAPPIDELEADFADVATRHREATSPPVDYEIDDDDIDVASPDPDRTRIQDSGAIRRPPDEEEDVDEEDEVFTSASRPRRVPPDPNHTLDDDLAPPPPPGPGDYPDAPAPSRAGPTKPPPMRTGPTSPPPMRTGPTNPPPMRPTPTPRSSPAIVRRVTAPQAVVSPPSPTPPQGVDISLFGDNTRVLQSDEVEDFASASRSPTLPPLAIDEDAYDDIEIDSAAPSEPASPLESSPATRRTAHVVRRAEPATKPPPVAREPSPSIGREEAPDPEPAIEMEADEPLEGGGEDDFSDVAAAVGASDHDVGMPPRRPDSRPQAVDLDLEDRLPPSLDAALGGLDEDDDDAPDHDVPAPTVIDTPRPPALMDLYPRVKTPTSVPPLGGPSIPSTIPEFGSHTPVGAVPPPAQLKKRVPAPRVPSAPASDVAEVEPILDLDTAARGWPEQVAPLSTSTLDEASAQALLVYEREVATLDDSETSAALRIEAGRLCERLSDLERARVHYDAALLADPRATAALRGLRRIARAGGDLGEVTRHLDTEIAVAGALERRPLGHYRIDLLLASNDQDLARVAVGELLDSAPSDVRALLAQLELAFLDGRADEFGIALEQIAHAVADSELRAAVQSARGALAAHHNDMAAASTWFAAAAESDPSALAARLGGVRQAAAQADGTTVASALVDLARQVEADPITAAAAAIRACQWVPQGHETAATASAIAAMTMPSDPLVARLVAEASTGDAAGPAFAHWAQTATAPAERAYAAARAAELDAEHAGTLWSAVLADDPGHDYAAAALRTAHVSAAQRPPTEDQPQGSINAAEMQAAIDVDLAIANGDPERERVQLRAAYGLITQGQLEAAIETLAKGRIARPGSLAIAEALGEALAASGKWTERAQLFAELAAEPSDQLDRDVAQLRSALAWEEAVGAASAAPEQNTEELQRLAGSALDAWERVLEHGPKNPAAHAATIVLANRLGDREVLFEVLARAQAAIHVQAGTDALAAASLAYRRARLVADDLPRAEGLLRDTQPLDDPRRAVALVMAAARAQDLADAAAALEERANQLRSAAPEAAALRLRAAQLALDANDAARATRLLQQVEQALPALGVVPDLLAAARRRAGDRPTAAQTRRSERVESGGASAADAFARVVRDADLSAAQGDAAGALALYQRALELKPGDPLASVPLVRVATELRDHAPLTALALAQLKTAEDAGDAAGKAVAYELIAQIDGELRNDASSSQIALESASESDPSRIDLMHRLEQLYAATDDLEELLRLRKAELSNIGPDHVRDRAALQLDLAGIAARDQRPEIELAELYRAVLETEPNTRLALLHLESIVRRSGASEELAALEEKIANYFDGEPKTQAAFWTRAGETLAEIGQIDAAVQRFGKADATLPGHVPALEGWRQAALKGALWIDVAEAASRQAQNTADPVARGALYHFAGVALMDKALVGEQAMGAFRRALDANQAHKDAFLRLRILLEEDANHDDLAILLSQRLEVERDPGARIELHRALAELSRNFLSDREAATKHFRAILELDPNDLRSHSAVADIAWEQGNWQEAADALMSRARLEREPEVLKTLCFRLGLIYADRLVDAPMALKAFQRALTYQPDDEATLVRLADLAAQIGEWKLALGACERLVKNETDADRRVAHLHRVARIFKNGFGDMKRAERALNLALDSSPTNDEALTELVQFYKDARDITSVRVHLNRVAGTMRTRLAQHPMDAVPYRVIARAMIARAATNVPGTMPIARAAAQLSELLGSAAESELRIAHEPARPDLSQLVKPESDEVLFPRSVQNELRQVFQLLGDRIAKHVGVNVQAYGVSRGDRVRAKDNPVAAVAQSVATALGFGDIDVYISNRHPWVMIAEPTSPVSLILGASIAAAGGDAIRFAAGGALKMAQVSLAIPARLPPEDLGVLVIALLRLFQPDFPVKEVDPDAVAAQFQKLRRLIPTNLLNELRPYALAVDPHRFGARDLSRDLKIAALRAGLIASGSILAGLRILASQADAELPGFLADPVAQGLVSFALGEDHAAIAR